MVSGSVVARAARNAERLRKLNIAVLCVAVVVYLGLLTIAATVRVGPLAVFSTCFMLAELLVFQIVRTLLDHLEIVRGSHASVGNLTDQQEATNERFVVGRRAQPHQRCGPRALGDCFARGRAALRHRVRRASR